MGVTLFSRSKQLCTSQSAESMLSPRVGGRAYQGGSDILAIFMPNSLPRGKRLMSNTPSLGIHFVWFWMIYNASQSFFLIGLIISHTLFRGVSPQIKCLLKLFSPTRTKAVGLNKVQNLPHFLFSGQKSMWGSQETCS